MAKYITRVRLHEAKQIDIEQLDIEMAKESFKRVGGTSDAGANYLSSSSEYNFQGNRSLLDVNATISRIVQKTGKKYSYTVIREKRVPVL